MMSIKNILINSSLVLLIASLSACNKYQTTGDQVPAADSQQQMAQAKTAGIQKMNTLPTATSLPVKYQTPTYMVGTDDKEEQIAEETTALKVGASIRSTRGPQPLWDILKRLAALKRMNVSWASDVDQNVLVDVDINANDDFYESIDNLLRQVDYFHEMEGNTIVVKYKETRRYQIAMPFTKQTYTTGTGGNVLGGNAEDSSNVDGTIQLKSMDNEFDVWKNIQENMDAIISTWNTKAYTPTDAEPVAVENVETTEKTTEGEKTETQVVTRRVSSGDSMYIIDKPVGMITVSAPRPLLERLDSYFKSLKEQLYKQITIEAKIIEVLLNDSSSIGINWTEVLQNFPIAGTVEFGTNGQIYPDVGGFISRITLDNADFSVFLNALKTQGDTTILSNPKLSVMNGQPALISVGRNVTYIDKVESEIDTDTNTTTYTATTARILSGVGMALTATVLDDDNIIMNLVPVTSELEGEVPYEFFGETGQNKVGVPIVNVREISTTVKLKSGEMLVIGGLISNSDQTTGNFAPVVGDIPLLRYLFGHEEKAKTKRELIVLLKPRII